MKFASNTQIETYAKDPIGLIIFGLISLVFGIKGMRKNINLLLSNGNYKMFLFLFLFSIIPSLALILFGLSLLILAIWG